MLDSYETHEHFVLEIFFLFYFIVNFPMFLIVLFHTTSSNGFNNSSYSGRRQIQQVKKHENRPSRSRVIKDTVK